jgi:ubiquinone/menaquinone biosynthesis C-methylase UbiE
MPLDQISYDELPYTCYPMPYAHPNNLFKVARQAGMIPPPVQTSRVLELGCCDGSHIIAIASSLPKTNCWGVDLSAENIVKGKINIKALSLQNITLKQINILEIDQQFGIFDYIIAHGIYSWVSSEVQTKILCVCKNNLAHNGVAYVSYDTKPGWFMRSTFRDMMLYHKNTVRTTQLKDLLAFFADTTAEIKTNYSKFANEAINQFRQLPESFIFEDLIEEQNEPLYFYEFMERAQAQGLSYLGDALYSPIPASHKNLIYEEQMVDFISNRHFRHTCLCNKSI